MDNPPALYALQKMNAAMAEALRQILLDCQYVAESNERNGPMFTSKQSGDGYYTEGYVLEKMQELCAIATGGLNYKLPKSEQAMITERNRRGGDDDA
mgnify:CR=1 FL=1